MTPNGAIKTEKTKVKTGFCSSLEEKCRRNESHESIIKNAFTFFSIFISNEEMLRTYCRLILTPPKFVNRHVSTVFISRNNLCSTAL